MRSHRITLTTEPCRRCGRPVTGLDRSISGANAAYEQYHHLCERCVTEAERAEILAEQAAAVTGRSLP